MMRQLVPRPFCQPEESVTFKIDDERYRSTQVLTIVAAVDASRAFNARSATGSVGPIGMQQRLFGQILKEPSASVRRLFTFRVHTVDGRAQVASRMGTATAMAEDCSVPGLTGTPCTTVAEPTGTTPTGTGTPCTGVAAATGKPPPPPPPPRLLL